LAKDIVDVMRVEPNIVNLFFCDNAAIVVGSMTSRYGKRAALRAGRAALPCPTEGSASAAARSMNMRGGAPRQRLK
jgi:hypothetical protein